MSLKRYMITDRRLAGGAESLLALIARRLAEGLDYIQIREKDLEARELFHFTTAVLRLPRRDTKIIVNGRTDIALATGAHGVHLPADSPAAGTLRGICPKRFLIGVSCHSPGEIQRAYNANANYCLYGPVFAPLSKQDLRAPRGIEGLRGAINTAPIPVFALGGVRLEDAAVCEQAGAAGIAGISLFL